MIRRQGLRTTSNGDLSKKLANVSAEKRNRVEQTNAFPIVSSWMLDVTRVFTSFDYTVCLLSSHERIDFLRDRYDPRYYTQSLLVAFYDKQGILWCREKKREPSVLEGSCREARPVDPLNELPDEEDEEDEDEDDDDDNDNDDDDDK
ncbi:hypothetical protein HZH68_006374 [Vespula germanica]|uniref:Uncharacterized protein n=1 Tax=Vespula germanica TaxID=30212 RepID=A0A834NC58_VESGE|nr:hypothetical protein HZH68_006374 [Vespula germanica]